MFYYDPLQIGNSTSCLSRALIIFCQLRDRYSCIAFTVAFAFFALICGAHVPHILQMEERLIYSRSFRCTSTPPASSLFISFVCRFRITLVQNRHVHHTHVLNMASTQNKQWIIIISHCSILMRRKMRKSLFDLFTVGIEGSRKRPKCVSIKFSINWMKSDSSEVHGKGQFY